MSARALILAVLAAAWLAPASVARAQSIADQVDAVRDGKVRMSFAARAGVCGDGRGGISTSGGFARMRRSSDDWESDCEPGPVRLVLRIRDGDVEAIDTYVGGRWRPAGQGIRDLGVVSAPGAARYLLALARRSEAGVGK
ncbi:MAG: hypothetical protein GTN88_09150, partial [Gammaproteobacteria bacterium]|nr:hypothetical protein [Gammaproteobacteria bacterium]